MNRRAFFAAISCLPFLGWLKPKPDPYWADPTSQALLREAIKLNRVVEPRLTDPNDWFLKNEQKLKESMVWFDEPVDPDIPFDEYCQKFIGIRRDE